MAATDFVHFLIGLLIILAPGFTAVWALVPGLDWAKTVAVGVVTALTIPPATIYVLNVFLGVPFTAMNLILIALGWTAIFTARIVQRELAGPKATETAT